ncbi:MAG: MMPL family transporter [Pseudonocardiaceae bacterium]
MRVWTGWVLQYRMVVVLFWVGLAGLGGALAPRTVDALSYDFALPGQPAYEANQEIVEQVGSGGVNDPLLLTLTVPNGSSVTDQAVQDQFTTAVNQVTSVVPGARIASYPSTQNPAFLSADQRTTFALVYPPPTPGPEPYAAARPALEAAVADVEVAGAPLRLTGVELLETSPVAEDRGLFFEVILGGVGAFVVLVLVFSSLLAAVPLLIASVSILTTFLCLLGLTAITDVSFVVQFLATLIGLGVAIDYALLIVMRWREERSRGAENTAAVHTAMETAGRSVIFSGITVAVSLAALVAIPVPFLRSIGYGGLLIPLLSVAVAVTLLPVILSTAGPWLEWPRRRPRDPHSRRWAAIAQAMTRRPRLAVLAATGLLLALAAPVFTLQLGAPQIDAYPAGDTAGEVAGELGDAGVPRGVFRPIEVLTTAPDDAVQRLTDTPGVAAALAPGGAGWTAGDAALVQVWTEDDPASSAGKSTVERVRATMADLPTTQVGGSAAEDLDFVDVVYGSAPVVVVVIIIVTLVLLARALRSVVLPVKALVLNVLSIGAAYGITVLIWQHGWLTQTIFGSEPSGAITTWAPIAVFAFLFGLSMDYELFILARMREEYDRAGSTDQAVVNGISYTGRLVTSGALILFLAFVALSTVPEIEVKILATALALGIAIDALVVRAVLTPAIVTLLGRANWWMPPRAARALRLRHDLGRTAAGTLTGSVRADSAPHGVPGALVTLVDVAGNVVAIATTDLEGRYIVHELPGGTYTLAAVAERCRPRAMAVTVPAGVRLERNIDLAARARLTGTVRSATTGKPIEEALVTVLDVDGTVLGAAITGQTGDYVFDELPEGNLTLTATGYPPVATRVELSVGVAPSVDVALPGPRNDA